MWPIRKSEEWTLEALEIYTWKDELNTKNRKQGSGEENERDTNGTKLNKEEKETC